MAFGIVVAALMLLRIIERADLCKEKCQENDLRFAGSSRGA